jgi:antitoxin VapB
MGINVKNAAVEEDIRLLASRLGLGLTEAIEQAVKARLGQLDAEKHAETTRKLAAIRHIQGELRPLLALGVTSDCGELYDDDGLPA